MAHETIGILGGLTAESTVLYYQHITRRYQELHGDSAYPQIVIYSVSFQQFEDWMEAGRWDDIAGALATALDRIAAAGADFALLATNTMHLLFDRLQASCPIPLLSIVDATADAVTAAGLTKVGLLGTRFTMEKPFYAEGLARRGIQAIVPDKEDRETTHRVIMHELARGVLKDDSRREYLRVMDALAAQGAEGFVLGCTEIPLLVTPACCSLPLFDTARIHAEAALQRALSRR
ncbi:MAG: aspartate/glutamate racemase family protein [Vicinamibacterales bacterium]